VAGRIDDAARYLQQIVTVEPYTAIARPLLGMVYALAGRHADALKQLDAPDGQDIAYVRGVALRGIGRVADALRVFEDLSKETPTHALACEQAARCCDELAAAARGKLRAQGPHAQIGTPSLHCGSVDRSNSRGIGGSSEVAWRGVSRRPQRVIEGASIVITRSPSRSPWRHRRVVPVMIATRTSMRSLGAMNHPPRPVQITGLISTLNNRKLLYFIP
jgi:hypothetical protein